MSSSQFVKFEAEKSSVLFSNVPHESGHVDFFTHDVICNDRQIIYDFTRQRDQKMKEEFFIAMDAGQLRYTQIHFNANEDVGQEITHIFKFDNQGAPYRYELETYNENQSKKFVSAWTEDNALVQSRFAAISIPETALAKEKFALVERMVGPKGGTLFEFAHNGGMLTDFHQEFKIEPFKEAAIQWQNPSERHLRVA